jgi:hypothetical protein
MPTTSTSINMTNTQSTAPNVSDTGPFNHFVPLLRTRFTTTHDSLPLASACNETAAHIVDIVSTSADPAFALCQLWNAFFLSAIASEYSYAPQLALLDALRAQPPTQPTNVVAVYKASMLRCYTKSDGRLHWSELPAFGWQRQDVYDALEAFRDWDSFSVSGPSESPTANNLGISGGETYLRFVRFSVALLKTTIGKDHVSPIQVFYTTRNVLESKGPKSKEDEAHRFTAEEVWSIDIEAAATWLIDGGRILWETDREDLRKHHGKSLDSPTELWPREDGLIPERWQLWEERLRVLSTEDGGLDEKVRHLAIRAADEIKSILEENQG